jgi:hypothetical protein
MAVMVAPPFTARSSNHWVDLMAAMVAMEQHLLIVVLVLLMPVAVVVVHILVEQ